MIIISAQRFLDEEIVEAKRAANDYEVAISPAFEIDGEVYCLVTDGHHSLEAAKRDGVEPQFIEQSATDNDRIGLLEAGNIEDFLVLSRIDCDFYDIATGRDIW